MISPVVLAVAATIAGSPVNVTCHERADFDTIAEGYGYNPHRVAALGMVGEPRIWLRAHDCRRLAFIGEGREVTRSRMWNQADAIQTLGHELGHVSGIRSEQEANRYGANVSKRIAKLLGHARPFMVRRLAWMMARNSEEGI